MKFDPNNRDLLSPIQSLANVKYSISRNEEKNRTEIFYIKLTDKDHIPEGAESSGLVTEAKTLDSAFVKALRRHTLDKSRFDRAKTLAKDALSYVDAMVSSKSSPLAMALSDALTIRPTKADPVMNAEHSNALVKDEEVDAIEDQEEQNDNHVDVSTMDVEELYAVKIYAGYVYDHQSEGYIILDPFFINEHPNIKCLSYKLVKDKIVEASRRGLTTDIECDNYYLFDFANKITSVLQVEDPKLKTFTNESIFSALARFFVPQNFLKFDEHPHYTETVLKAFAIHGLTDKVNELVEIESAKNNGDYSLSPISNLIDCLSLDEVINTIKEDESFEPKTLLTFDGVEHASLREHPDLKIDFAFRCISASLLKTPIKSAIFGKYDTAIGHFVTVSYSEKIEVLLLNNIFCYHYPEFANYTILSYDGVLHYFNAEACMVGYPNVHKAIRKLLSCLIPSRTRAHGLALYLNLHDEIPSATAIAQSSIKPLSDIYNAPVKAVKIEGNRYSVLELEEDNTASKKKSKSRKSKSKAKGDVVGKIMTPAQKTGWVIFEPSFLEKHPELIYRYGYMDGNRLRIYDTDATFPGDGMFWLARHYTFSEDDLGPKFSPELKSQLRQRTFENSLNMLSVLHEIFVDLIDGVDAENLDDARSTILYEHFINLELLASSDYTSPTTRNYLKELFYTEDWEHKDSFIDQLQQCLDFINYEIALNLYERRGYSHIAAPCRAITFVKNNGPEIFDAFVEKMLLDGIDAADAVIPYDEDDALDCGNKENSSPIDNDEASLSYEDQYNLQANSSSAQESASASEFDQTQLNPYAEHTTNVSTSSAYTSTSDTTSGSAGIELDVLALKAKQKQFGILAEDGQSFVLCGISSLKDGPKLNLIPSENKNGGFGYYTPKRENGILVNKIDTLAGSIVSFGKEGWLCFETEYLTPRPYLSDFYVYSYNDKLWFYNVNEETEKAFAQTPDFFIYSFLKMNKDATAKLDRSSLSVTDYIYEEEPVVSDTEIQAAQEEINAVIHNNEPLLDDSDAQVELELSDAQSDMSLPITRAIVGDTNLSTANDCVIEEPNESDLDGIDPFDAQTSHGSFVSDLDSGNITNFDGDIGADNSFDASELTLQSSPSAYDLGPSPADDEDLLVSDQRLDMQIEEQLEKNSGGFLERMIDDAQEHSGSSSSAQASMPINNPPKLNLKLAPKDGQLCVFAYECCAENQSSCTEVYAGSFIGTKDNGWVLFEPMYIGLHPELQYLIVRYHNGTFEYFDAYSYPDDPNFEEFGMQRFDTDYLNKVLEAVSQTTPIASVDESNDIANVDPLDTADFEDAAEAMVDAAVHDAFEGKENIGVFARDCDPAAGCRSFLAPDGSQIDALVEHPALCLQLKHDHLSGYMLLDDNGRFAGTLVSQIPGSLCGWVRLDEEYLKVNPKLNEYHIFFDQDKIFFYPRVEIDDDDFRLYQSPPEDVEHRLLQQSADLSDSEPAVAALKEMGAYTSMPCYTEIVKSRVEVESDEEFKQLCSDGLKELTDSDSSLSPALVKAGLPTTKFDNPEFAAAYLQRLKDSLVFKVNGIYVDVYAPKDAQFTADIETQDEPLIIDDTDMMSEPHLDSEGCQDNVESNVEQMDSSDAINASEYKQVDLECVGQIPYVNGNGYICFSPQARSKHPELDEILVLHWDDHLSLENLFDYSKKDLGIVTDSFIFRLQSTFTDKYHLGSPKDYLEVLRAFKAGFKTYPENELSYSLSEILQERPEANVLLFGGAFVDVTLGLDKVPETGGDAHARELNKGVGGCPLNVAHALRTLDITHQLKVPMGNGPYADLIKAQLLSDGYDESNFIIDETVKYDCGYCLCMVDRNGERTFVTVPGIENHAKAEWFDDLDLSKTALIYVSGFDLFAKSGEIYLSRLKEKLQEQNLLGKVVVFFDAGARLEYISPEAIEILLSLNPIVHCNRMELELFTGQRDIYKGIMSLSSRTSAPVIVSLDKDGCMVAYKSRCYNFSIKPLPVVDATGAGDCHSAGIIASLIKGKPLHNAIEAGHELAACCIKHIGSRLNIDSDDLKKFKRTYL